MKTTFITYKKTSNYKNEYSKEHIEGLTKWRITKYYNTGIENIILLGSNITENAKNKKYIDNERHR